MLKIPNDICLPKKKIIPNTKATTIAITINFPANPFLLLPLLYELITVPPVFHARTPLK